MGMVLAELSTPVLIAVVAAVAIVGLAAGYLVRVLLARLSVRDAERTSDRLLEEAKQKAERLVREAELQAKQEVLGRREAFEKESQQVRQEQRQTERRLEKREDTLDRKEDLLDKKEKYLETTEKNISEKRKQLTLREQELEDLVSRQKEELTRVSGLTEQAARQMLMERLQSSVEQDCLDMVTRRVQRAEDEADEKAREIIVDSIQRCAAETTSEATVCSIELPSDEIKGRIIGREGRNIRAFEKATGVDVIVDDTPGVVVLSGFDSVRREVARITMERLVADGRIHPSRIEDMAKGVLKEVENIIGETGKKVCYDVNVGSVHAQIRDLLGRLKYRTSFGQNVLQHSIQVCHLAGLMAGELGLDVMKAKRCGLLHDIGKALDHEIEGSHAQIGADFARRCGETPEIVNAIAAHHEETSAESLYAGLIIAADAISASRPGARRESLERYIKRLQNLESIATGFPGVDGAYAIQAGREVRVLVNAEKVSDKLSAKMARDIANQIESELNYPGEVAVTVIRETRFVEKAR
jgi:ribonuclease Y